MPFATTLQPLQIGRKRENSGLNPSTAINVLLSNAPTPYAAALILACGIAQAGRVIYDNHVSVDDAWSSDVDYPDFQAVLLPSVTTIADFHWTGVYACSDTPSATDNFTIQIFADSSGAPGALLHTVFNGDPGRMDTGTDLVGYDLYARWVVITPLTVAAGTT